MKPSFSAETLVRGTGGAWSVRPPSRATGISKDTRSLRPGELYVALRGERFDGHAFVEAAFAAGAVGAMVEEGYAGPEPGPLLRVRDPLDGLRSLACAYRDTWRASVVGITGSVGKTTVKEMIASVLSEKGKTHRTEGNLNNHIGLPLSMLAMPTDAETGVFELGMSRPGEIAELAELLRPEIGVVVAVGAAHLEAFGSVEEIADEKGALPARLPEDGAAWIDADSEWAERLRARSAAPVRTVSLSGEADCAGRPVPGGVEVDGFFYPLRWPGRHVALNALFAIALGREAGLGPEGIAAGLAAVRLPGMRWEERESGGVRFVNDAYNANPLSMRAALRTFAEDRRAGARWAVLGAMRELGEAARTEHVELGRFLAGLDLDGVVAVGEEAAEMATENVSKTLPVRDVSEAARLLKERLRPGDAVLLKASRGERLERIIELFEKEP